jgi:DNA-binding ferritin-like protein (Dps family)
MKKLTARGKQIVIISAVFALIVILAVVFQLVAGSQSETAATGRPSALILIAVLAVAACAFAFFKYYVRIGHTKKLNAQYYEKYERIKLALKNTNLGYLERKDVASDILALLISAQNDNKAPGEVIADPVEYIKNLTDSFGKRSKFVFALISGLQMSIYTLAIVQVAVFFMRDGPASFYEASTGISIIIYILLLAFVLIPIVKTAIVSKKMLKAGIAIAVLIAVYFASHELMDAFGENVSWIQYYLNAEVVFIPSFVMALVWAAVMLALTVLRLLLRKRSIKSL